MSDSIERGEAAAKAVHQTIFRTADISGAIYQLITELKVARAERNRLYDVEQMAEQMADADDGIIFGLLTPDEAKHYLRMARAVKDYVTQ